MNWSCNKCRDSGLFIRSVSRDSATPIYLDDSVDQFGGGAPKAILRSSGLATGIPLRIEVCNCGRISRRVY